MAESKALQWVESWADWTDSKREEKWAALMESYLAALKANLKAGQKAQCWEPQWVEHLAAQKVSKWEHSQVAAKERSRVAQKASHWALLKVGSTVEMRAVQKVQWMAWTLAA